MKMSITEMRELLCRIGIEPSDREFIVIANKVMGEAVEPFANEYFENLNELIRSESYKKTREFLKRVDEVTAEGYHKYTTELLFWLYTIPLMKTAYEEKGISEEILYESMTDISYKVRECRELYGITGTFCDWFFLFVALKLFAFGRLQYEIAEFMPEYYSRAGVELKKGDLVYSCHIPSSGKLTPEMCLDSYKRAYEFFKPQLKSNIMPIICHSYLFWPPYIGRVFEEGTNLYKFATSFEKLLEFKTEPFNDCWRVFNHKWPADTKDLPNDTSLRRNFIKYIDEGGEFGNAYVILLFDGERGEII